MHGNLMDNLDDLVQKADLQEAAFNDRILGLVDEAYDMMYNRNWKQAGVKLESVLSEVDDESLRKYAAKAFYLAGVEESDYSKRKKLLETSLKYNPDDALSEKAYASVKDFKVKKYTLSTDDIVRTSAVAGVTYIYYMFGHDAIDNLMDNSNFIFEFSQKGLHRSGLSRAMGAQYFLDTKNYFIAAASSSFLSWSLIEGSLGILDKTYQKAYKSLSFLNRKAASLFGSVVIGGAFGASFALNSDPDVAMYVGYATSSLMQAWVSWEDKKND